MTVSDEERHRMEEILEEDEFKEKAIHLIGISENRGISENTNAAIKEAAGTYIGFLDQDDLLAGPPDHRTSAQGEQGALHLAGDLGTHLFRAIDITGDRCR